LDQFCVLDLVVEERAFQTVDMRCTWLVDEEECIHPAVEFVDTVVADIAVAELADISVVELADIAGVELVEIVAGEDAGGDIQSVASALQMLVLLEEVQAVVVHKVVVEKSRALDGQRAILFDPLAAWLELVETTARIPADSAFSHSLHLNSCLPFAFPTGRWPCVATCREDVTPDEEAVLALS